MIYNHETCTVEVIYYAPVGPTLISSQIVKRCPSIEKFPEGGKRMFIDYFCELVKSRRSNVNEYTAYLVDSRNRNYRKRELDALLTCDLSSNLPDFKSTCSDLADIFQEKVQLAAKDGILFITRILVSSNNQESRFICILKLEPSHQGVLYVAENLIKFDSFDEMLPGPKDLQKGAVIPHPSGVARGVKVAQTDGHADYFINFLGVYRAIPTQDTVRFLLEAIEDAKSESITLEETLDLFEKLEEKVPSGFEILARVDLANAVIEAIEFDNPRTAKNKITALAQQEDLIRGVISKSALDNMKLKILIGDITISGTSKSIREKVQHESDGEEHKITVKGARVAIDAGLK
ncbi:MAG: hypothetical protein ACTSV2_14125 [Candidatus Thorarchaeota archaeon]